jgi:hypothetical protein
MWDHELSPSEMKTKNKRIAAYIGASILVVTLIALYSWQANQFLVYHLNIASDWVSNRRISELQPLLAILILAGGTVRLPRLIELWLKSGSKERAMQSQRLWRLRINWRLLLIQGLPALFLMEFPSFLFLIGEAIWREPFYLLPGAMVLILGYGEFVLNSVAAFWLGGTLVGALELA